MYSTFSSAYNQVLTSTGVITTDTDNISKAKDLVNRVHKEILAFKPWPFLQKSGSTTTQPPYNTGFVTFTQGLYTFTGSGTAFTSGHVGWKIKLNGSQNLYVISAVNVGLQTLTVTPQIADVSAVTQGFNVFQNTYTFPTDFRMPTEFDNFIDNPPMDFVGYREYRRLSNNGYFSTPCKWTIVWETSSTSAPLPKLSFFPFPDKYYAITYDYQIIIADLINDSDPILIPDAYQQILIEGALQRYYRDEMDDPQRAGQSEGEFIRIRKQMTADYNFYDDPPKLIPFDFRGSGYDNFDDYWAIMRTTWQSR